MNKKQQTSLFRGLYDFDDLSGVLLCAKVPAVGSVDLYSGTAVIVKPNQSALFIYKGEIADVLPPGLHEIETQNTPLLTRMANWKYGFQSPLQCELLFISKQVFTGRRWGTPQPVIAQFEGFGPLPIRAFGQYNIAVNDPKIFHSKFIGTQSTFAITDLEAFVQGQIAELLPRALREVKKVDELSASYSRISEVLENALQTEMFDYGLKVDRVQLLSALPSKEILEAMEAKTAISILGSQREYLLYKTANSMGQTGGDSKPADPLQVMMGLMLGKGLLGADYHAKANTNSGGLFCERCGSSLKNEAVFCGQCGKKVKDEL